MSMVASFLEAASELLSLSFYRDIKQSLFHAILAETRAKWHQASRSTKVSPLLSPLPAQTKITRSGSPADQVLSVSFCLL